MNAVAQKKIITIMELALKLNSTPTSKEKTGSKPTVFVSYSGHVTVLNVVVYEEGWSEDENEDNKQVWWILLSHEDEVEVERQLDITIDRLTELLEKWGG